ncbi:hypothetical protein IWW50_005916, partial [Coemansia erecta]
PSDIKFMLLEVSTVQKQLHSVLKNRFDSDTLDNETTFSAFRYCLRDMLKLFQVMNFGVMKMLKVYFQMQEEDMRRALDLYKRFVKLTDRTAEYLKIARQFEAIFGFTIPNLTHAPLSLSRALEDFLNMPLDERRETVSAMKSAAPKKQPPAQARTNSGGGSGGNGDAGTGSTRMGPNGRAKPDYGLRLKPELLALSDESPPQSAAGTANPASRERAPALPKAAAIASTSTLDQPTNASVDASAAAGKAAAPATKEIDFIDFFASIDDEATSTAADQGPHVGGSGPGVNSAGMAGGGSAQPNDFDAMFLALSNPFAASNNGGLDASAVQQQSPFSTISSTPIGAVQQQQQQPFNAFGGDTSTALVSANNAFASPMQSSTPFGSVAMTANTTPFQTPQMPQMPQDAGGGFASVAANNPFRQSMFPAQSDAASQQALMVSQMAQMSLQQQQQQEQLQLQQEQFQLQQEQQRAQLLQQQEQQAAYNPFAQRQTMYMADSNARSQPALQQSQAAASFLFANSSTNQYSAAGSQQNAADPFAHFNAAFSTSNTSSSMTASLQQQQQPQQQQQQQPQQLAGAHNLQSAMTNGNFANFDFFK